MELFIKELSVHYTNFDLDVHNLSFQKGINMIIGGNGSGKSTLLNGIIGYEFNHRNVLFNNEQLVLNKDVTFLPQNLNRPDMTIKDFTELTSGQNSDDLLKQFDLYHLKNLSCLNVSGGEFKRAAFVQAILENKPILILDEIEQGLDIKYKKEMFQYIKELSKERVVILNVHDLSLVLSYADKIFGMKKGKVNMTTLPNDITADDLSDVFNVPIEITTYNGKRLIVL